MEPRTKRQTGSRATARAAAALALMLWAGPVFAAAAPAFTPGQYWVYAHQGPRPGGGDTNAINGQRILQVLGRVGSGTNAQWVLEEKYTGDTNVITRLQIRGDRKVTAMLVANAGKPSLALTYTKPVPYQYVDMPAGGAVRLETALVTQSGGYGLPVTIEISRLEDETVQTPAGHFAHCRHYRSVADALIDMKVAKLHAREQRQWWWSSEVGATVKEIYTKEPIQFGGWSQAGFTSTSTLTAFGVRTLSSEARAALAGSANAMGALSANPSTSWKGYLRLWAGIAAGGLALVLMVVLVRRRTRLRTRPRPRDPAADHSRPPSALDENPNRSD